MPLEAGATSLTTSFDVREAGREGSAAGACEADAEGSAAASASIASGSMSVPLLRSAGSNSSIQ